MSPRIPLLATALALGVAAPAAAQLPALTLPVPTPAPTPATPTTESLLPGLADTVDDLQAQVDELLGTGALPSDPQALQDAVQAINDLIANAPAGSDISGLVDKVATLTDSANAVLAATPGGSAQSVKPAPTVSAALQAARNLGGTSPAPAGSRLAKAGRLKVTSTRLKVARNGRAKLRVVCDLASAGCAGVLRTYSKLGRLRSTGGKVGFLAPGAAKSVSFRFSKASRRRLRKDKRISLLVLSTYSTRAVKRLRVSVR